MGSAMCTRVAQIKDVDDDDDDDGNEADEPIASTTYETQRPPTVWRQVLAQMHADRRCWFAVLPADVVDLVGQLCGPIAGLGPHFLAYVARELDTPSTHTNQFWTMCSTHELMQIGALNVIQDHIANGSKTALEAIHRFINDDDMFRVVPIRVVVDAMRATIDQGGHGLDMLWTLERKCFALTDSEHFEYLSSLYADDFIKKLVVESFSLSGESQADRFARRIGTMIRCGACFNNQQKAIICEAWHRYSLGEPGEYHCATWLVELGCIVAANYPQMFVTQAAQTPCISWDVMFSRLIEPMVFFWTRSGLLVRLLASSETVLSAAASDDAFIKWLNAVGTELLLGLFYGALLHHRHVIPLEAIRQGESFRAHNDRMERCYKTLSENTL